MKSKEPAGANAAPYADITHAAHCIAALFEEVRQGTGYISPMPADECLQFARAVHFKTLEDLVPVVCGYQEWRRAVFEMATSIKLYKAQRKAWAQISKWAGVGEVAGYVVLREAIAVSTLRDAAGGNSSTMDDIREEWADRLKGPRARLVKVTGRDYFINDQLTHAIPLHGPQFQGLITYIKAGL